MGGCYLMRLNGLIWGPMPLQLAGLQMHILFNQNRNNELKNENKNLDI